MDFYVQSFFARKFFPGKRKEELVEKLDPIFIIETS